MARRHYGRGATSVGDGLDGQDNRGAVARMNAEQFSAERANAILMINRQCHGLTPTRGYTYPVRYVMIKNTLFYLVIILINAVVMCVYGDTNVIRNIVSADGKQTTSDFKGVNHSVTHYEGSNVWLAKGILWGDSITNDKYFYMSCLIRNNTKQKVYVPKETFASCNIDYTYKITNKADVYYQHREWGYSGHSEYEILERNEIKIYTVQLCIDIGKDGVVEGGPFKLIMNNHLTADDRKIMNEKGIPYIEDIMYEYESINYVNKTNVSKTNIATP